jgi:hypothetical protein
VEIPAVVRGSCGRARKQLATTTADKVMAAAVEVYPNIASAVLLIILA